MQYVTWSKGAITAFISGLAFIFSFLQVFFKFPRWAFKTLGGIYFFCFLTQLLTFFVINNDFCNGKLNNSILEYFNADAGISCDLSTDAYLAISAAVFFLALGILIMVCPTPEKSISRALCNSCFEDEHQQQQQQQGKQVHPQVEIETGKQPTHLNDVEPVESRPNDANACKV